MSRISAIILTVALAMMMVACAIPSWADRPAPTINSISPAGVTAGSPGFTLTVMGSNFSPSSVVVWNGSARATTFVSKSQLLAAILSADVAQAGTTKISVASSNANWNSTISDTFAMTISASAPLQIVTTSLPTAVVETLYAAKVANKGGIPPYTWKLTSGQLPPGLALGQADGTVSGVPEQKGNYSFVTQVTDSSPTLQSTSQTVAMSVAAPSLLLISTAALPNGTVQVAYSAAMAASGGSTPYMWSIVSGALPPGLALGASTGIISGTPTQAGGYTFTVQVRDSEVSPQSATQALAINVASAALQIATSSLASGQVQVAYSAALSASGGTAPYTWSVASGSLPPGLALVASTGQISGTPSTAGSFGFVIQVRDSVGQSSSASFSINIASRPSLAITTASLPNGTVGTGYSAALQASGGTQPYSWSITAGQLPSGLSLAATSGIVSGTPTVSGSSSFTVQATDASSQVASLGLTVSISSAPSGQATPATYTSRTDLNAAPETIPTLCSPAPCKMTSSDLNPNLTYTRVTDANTGSFGTQWGTSNSIDNIWSIDNSTFYLVNFRGGATAFTFSPSTQLATPVPCTYSDGGLTCQNNVLTPTGPFNTNDVSYSWVTPNIIYGFSGNLLQSLDFRATFANPATPPTRTTLADMSTCPGIPNPSGYSSIVTVSSDDSRFHTMTGGSQDNASLIYTFDKNLGCRWLRTDTMQIGGQWGTTGSVVWHDVNGNVVTAPSITGLHGSQISPDGRWAQFSTNTPASLSNDSFYWDLATNNIYDQSYNSCWLGGHTNIGFDNKILVVGGSNALLFELTLPTLNSCTSISPTEPANYYSADGGAQTHDSWKNARAGQSLPVTVSVYMSVAPTVAWHDEIVGAATDGSNTVWRFAHMYTRSHDYNSTGLHSISHDGKWVIWCSDWGGTLRDDVFLIPLK